MVLWSTGFLTNKVYMLMIIGYLIVLIAAAAAMFYITGEW